VDGTRQISFAELERMMKVQDVVLRAMSGKLKWWEAAEIIGVTDRTMRRWQQRYEEHAYDGLYDYRSGQPSPKRMAVKTLEQSFNAVGSPAMARSTAVRTMASPSASSSTPNGSLDLLRLPAGRPRPNWLPG
jgi:Helix-turn-helix domain